MKKLLSLPENLVSVIHRLEGLDPGEWLAASDPPGGKVGSGGGTAHLLALDGWPRADRRIVVHAGGQSRRLPAYAPSGKILTPLPVFRWARGQSLTQNLLQLQLPLFERILAAAGAAQNTLIASGDVLILAPQLPRNLPAVDVLCFGIWVDPQLASRHGVFFTPRHDPTQLEFMLQKPSHQEIEDLAGAHLFQMDVGLWVLSDRAVGVLMKQAGWEGGAFSGGRPAEYDLYGSFGPALGRSPHAPDPEVSALSVAVVPLEGGEFHHFGTSGELITSMGRIQDRVVDQRAIWHHRVKPQPTLFVQNAVTDIAWTSGHQHIWIENSWVGRGWSLSDHHVLTGIPENDWTVDLEPGVCVDFVPLADGRLCLRPYGITDAFQGDPASAATTWFGRPAVQWLADRGLGLDALGGAQDLQKAPLFPVLAPEELSAEWLAWMTAAAPTGGRLADVWRAGPRLSAEQISVQADLTRVYAQRTRFRRQTLPLLAANHRKSVFYQADLRLAARDYAEGGLELPAPLGPDAPVTTRFRDQMFRAEVLRRKGFDGSAAEKAAFRELQEALIGTVPLTAQPRLGVAADQIVWGRSPARLDLAGGWSDTPPYCIQSGGRVVNLAVDLNGQPPLQVFIRRSDEPKIVLRSIDNGVSEEITEFRQLDNLASLGSAFSIPRAALALAGFHPRFNPDAQPSLAGQLRAFGGGMELSLLSAIPKGSGLGTSSILAATVLGALSDFCSLGWTTDEVGHRTLVLEQLLTTGGGWQDQYGGLFPGLKLLETEPGWQDRVTVRWLSDQVFSHPEFRDHWRLYYTGITRVAKTILGEIVAGMFLNEGSRLSLVDDIKAHALATVDALQGRNLPEVGRAIGRSWALNKALDPGTSSPAIDALVDRIVDRSHGFKLLGAGGGGYLLICAKDPAAARSIEDDLKASPPNAHARFVRMTVSEGGFQLSRS